MLQTMRVKITNLDLPEPVQTWYATSTLAGTPEQTIARLNKLAKARNLNSTYEPATEEQYQGHKQLQRSAT